MGQIYTVLQNEIRYTLFIFFNKMKNKLILITAVCKILKTFDMRDCLHTFIAPECGRRNVEKNKLLEVEGWHLSQCPTAGDANEA